MNDQARDDRADLRGPARHDPRAEPELMGMHVTMPAMAALFAVAVATGVYYLALLVVFAPLAQNAVGRPLSRAFPAGMPAFVLALLWAVSGACFLYVAVSLSARIGVL